MSGPQKRELYLKLRAHPEVTLAGKGVQIDDMTAQKLQVFMDAKEISCSIPVSSFSKSDYQKMYGHVLSQGQIPDCASRLQPTQDKTADFHKSIAVQELTKKKQLLITQYRNLLNQLQKLGFSPSELETVKAEISFFREEYTHLENEWLALSGKYKKLHLMPDTKAAARGGGIKPVPAEGADSATSEIVPTEDETL